MDFEKHLRLRFEHSIPPAKSSKFLEWMRSEHPGKEIHHLLGSQTGIKMTDFLAVALTREEHVRAEQNKSYYFVFYLPTAIKNLIKYIIFLEG